MEPFKSEIQHHCSHFSLLVKFYELLQKHNYNLCSIECIVSFMALFMLFFGEIFMVLWLTDNK